MEHTKMPKASVSAPNFLDMVPPRNNRTETLYPLLV